MPKELRIKHSELRNPSNCSTKIEEAFHAAGLDVHRDEINEMTDDFDRDERIIHVRTRKVMVGFGRSSTSR